MARLKVLLVMLCALTGFSPTSVDARIMFASQATVPRSVQEFAWHVIETRCNYQSHERRQRSFWAHDARRTTSEAGVVYSINVLSDVSWKKAEPPALIEMTLIDDGGIRLAALKSSFVVCTP